MDSDLDWKKAPLSCLTNDARKLLCMLLDTEKVLPSEGSRKLARDWTGLACLLELTVETVAHIRSGHKTADLLDSWSNKRDGTDNVQQLMEYLVAIDRYDVYDDLKELDEKKELMVSPDVARPLYPPNQVQRPDTAEQQCNLTYDDVYYGSIQYYDAFVLYAKEDLSFVTELLHRMRSRKHKICIEEDMMTSNRSRYATVFQLLATRCRKIILVLSPDFFKSPANNFFSDCAQYFGIERSMPCVIPCQIRKCEVSPPMEPFHRLYYSSSPTDRLYDFWERLHLELKNDYYSDSVGSNFAQNPVIEEPTSSNTFKHKTSYFTKFKKAMELGSTSTQNDDSFSSNSLTLNSHGDTSSEGNISVESNRSSRSLLNLFKLKKKRR